MNQREIYTYLLAIAFVLLMFMAFSGCAALKEREENKDFTKLTPLFFEILGDKDAKK